MACRKILSPEVDSQTAKMGSLGCRMNRDSSGDVLGSDRGRLTENILFMKEGRGLALQSERASVAGLSGSWLCTGDGGRLQEQTSGRPFRCHLPLGAVCPGPQSSLLGPGMADSPLWCSHQALCSGPGERAPPEPNRGSWERTVASLPMLSTRPKATKSFISSLWGRAPLSVKLLQVRFLQENSGGGFFCLSREKLPSAGHSCKHHGWLDSSSDFISVPTPTRPGP